MGLSQRRKGRAFEQRVARDLREIYGPGVKRGWQARAGSADALDIEGTPWAIECKDQLAPSVWAALEQARSGARLSMIPVAICKRPREEPIVAMGYNDWLFVCGQLTGAIEVFVAEEPAKP